MAHKVVMFPGFVSTAIPTAMIIETGNNRVLIIAILLSNPANFVFLTTNITFDNHNDKYGYGRKYPAHPTVLLPVGSHHLVNPYH